MFSPKPGFNMKNAQLICTLVFLSILKLRNCAGNITVDPSNITACIGENATIKLTWSGVNFTNINMESSTSGYNTDCNMKLGTQDCTGGCFPFGSSASSASSASCNSNEIIWKFSPLADNNFNEHTISMTGSGTNLVKKTVQITKCQTTTLTPTTTTEQTTTQKTLSSESTSVTTGGFVQTSTVTSTTGLPTVTSTTGLPDQNTVTSTTGLPTVISTTGLPDQNTVTTTIIPTTATSPTDLTLELYILIVIICIICIGFFIISIYYILRTCGICWFPRHSEDKEKVVVGKRICCGKTCSEYNHSSMHKYRDGSDWELEYNESMSGDNAHSEKWCMLKDMKCCDTCYIAFCTCPYKSCCSTCPYKENRIENRSYSSQRTPVTS